MNLLTPSTGNASPDPSDRLLNQVNRENVGYLRLLSQMLDEPVESLVHQLQAEIPVVAALSSREREPAA